MNKFIDPEKLKVGDVFYGVKERNTSFMRKKIHQVIDGEDWFKYDLPPRTYELVTYKVKGVLRKQLEGEWLASDRYELTTGYFLTSTDETHMHTYTTDVEDLELRDLFVDKDDALAYIKTLEHEAREADKA